MSFLIGNDLEKFRNIYIFKKIILRIKIIINRYVKINNNIDVNRYIEFKEIIFNNSDEFSNLLLKELNIIKPYNCQKKIIIELKIKNKIVLNNLVTAIFILNKNSSNYKSKNITIKFINAK
jgi:hypothetical protein